MQKKDMVVSLAFFLNASLNPSVNEISLFRDISETRYSEFRDEIAYVHIQITEYIVILSASYCLFLLLTVH